MVGEVWLASGQSNMEMPIKGYPSEPINGNNELILHSKNSNIRMFTVKRNSSLLPAEDCIGSWRESESGKHPQFQCSSLCFRSKNQSCFGYPCWDHPQQLGRDSGRGLDTKRSNGQGRNRREKSTFRYNQVKNKREQDAPSQLFNGMIHPLLNYNIKGVIWYQENPTAIIPRFTKRHFH